VVDSSCGRDWLKPGKIYFRLKISVEKTFIRARSRGVLLNERHGK
jgi:hypothetical protein